PCEFCVTLNHTDAINPATILKRITYHHPLYTPEAIAAQQRHGGINGKNRTFYYGAYWGFGFHEDGVKSAMAACRPLEKG
nr:FAD-dependent oxidoreductase [Nitrospira sp.]